MWKDYFIKKAIVYLLSTLQYFLLSTVLLLYAVSSGSHEYKLFYELQL